MSDVRILRGAAAGATAATVWALQEPLDKRVFGVDYSDAQLMGLRVHILNGAIFGSVYAKVHAHVPGRGPVKGMVAGMAEHLATWPLTRFIPRLKLFGNHRAFAQAVWRHLLFGAILGVLYEGYADDTPA